MESFKSTQFTGPLDKSGLKPMKLPSHTRKLYPELASILDMQVKQERLRKLQLENSQDTKEKM